MSSAQPFTERSSTWLSPCPCGCVAAQAAFQLCPGWDTGARALGCWSSSCCEDSFKEGTAAGQFPSRALEGRFPGKMLHRLLGSFPHPLVSILRPHLLLASLSPSSPESTLESCPHSPSPCAHLLCPSPPKSCCLPHRPLPCRSHTLAA